jgi:hypothetical protein
MKTFSDMITESVAHLLSACKQYLANAVLWLDEKARIAENLKLWEENRINRQDRQGF